VNAYGENIGPNYVESLSERPEAAGSQRRLSGLSARFTVLKS